MPETYLEVCHTIRLLSRLLRSLFDLARSVEGEEDSGRNEAQKIFEPPQEAGEVVAGGGHFHIEAVAIASFEKVSLHSVVVFHMADDGLNGGSSPEFSMKAWLQAFSP